MVTFLITLILNYGTGILIGYALELGYRSAQEKRYVPPQVVNVQMYGVAAVFLFLLSLTSLSPILLVVLILAGTTAIEGMLGYYYLRFRHVRLWDYTDEPLNWRGIISLKFSLYWLAIALVYYYALLPLFPLRS